MRKGSASPMSAKVYTAESPLRYPVQFLQESAQDLVVSEPFARRLFRQLIAQRYRRSSLGLLWAFAPPIITTLFLALSRHSAPTSTVSIAPALYAVFGLLMAQTFLETFFTQRTIFSTNRILIGRQRSTVEALVLAGLYDGLFGLAIKAAIVVGFMIAYHTAPTSTLPLGLLGIGVIFLLGSGLGLCFAPLSAINTDVDKILAFLPWLLFGLTPVFAPAVAGSGMSRIYNANPFTWIFDAVRGLVFGPAHGQIAMLSTFLMISIFVLPAALLFCRIARPHVVERLLD